MVPPKQENSVPNLDCMDPAELWDMWKRWRIRSPKEARLLFPERPKGYVGAMQDLACYASNKATAIGCRLGGDIQAALVYESICDRIYERLPEWARW